jgi:beta-glucosidase
MAGHETAQLYVRDVESSELRPVKELKGFKKVYLKVNETQQVRLVLKKPDFSFWSEEKSGWTLEPGEFEILVGSSSADIRLRSSVTVIS